jgi:hypothetical protein
MAAAPALTIPSTHKAQAACCLGINRRDTIPRQQAAGAFPQTREGDRGAVHCSGSTNGGAFLATGGALWSSLMAKLVPIAPVPW